MNVLSICTHSALLVAFSLAGLGGPGPSQAGLDGAPTPLALPAEYQELCCTNRTGNFCTTAVTTCKTEILACGAWYVETTGNIVCTDVQS